jgi:hypothetical protein
VREGSRVVTVPACLSVFRVDGDGRLDFVRKYDVETNGKFQWWMGMVGLPGRGSWGNTMRRRGKAETDRQAPGRRRDQR